MNSSTSHSTNSHESMSEDVGGSMAESTKSDKTMHDLLRASLATLSVSEGPNSALTTGSDEKNSNIKSSLDAFPLSLSQGSNDTAQHAFGFSVINASNTTCISQLSVDMTASHANIEGAFPTQDSHGDDEITETTGMVETPMAAVTKKAKELGNLEGKETNVDSSKVLDPSNELHHVNIASCDVADEGVVALGKALEQTIVLRRLYLSISSISDNGVATLTKALHVNKSMKWLDLSHSHISHTGIMVLAKVLERNFTLEKLAFRCCDIGDEGATAFANALQPNECLQSLNLSSNNIGISGVLALGKALECNSTLRMLDIGDNTVGDEGAAALGKAVHSNKQLENLSLTRSSIGDEGAKAFADALETNEALLCLDLSLNSIGDDGGVALAKALEYNTKLRTISCCSNFIGEKGARALLEALACHNGTITHAFLVSDDVSDDVREQIDSLLVMNSRGERIPPPSPRTVMFSPSKASRIYIEEESIMDSDVVGGSDSTGSDHPGNVSYRSMVDDNKERHRGYGNQHKEKTKIRNTIVDSVIGHGGRFVKKEGGRFFLLTKVEAQRKVTEALKPRKSRAKSVDVA